MSSEARKGGADELSVGRKGSSFSRSRCGCVTCRRRKVKCDETRPICRSCSRLRLECEYVDTTPRPRTKRASGRSSQRADHEPLTLASKDTQQILPETDPMPTANSSPNIHAANQLVGVAAWPNPGPSTQAADEFASQISPDGLWDLDLLREESIWGQLPIFRNDFNATEPEMLGSVLQSIEPTEQPTATLFAENEAARCGESNLHAPLDARQQPAMNDWPVPEFAGLLGTSPVSTVSLSDIPPLEVTLLRHFIDFAVPPILIGVEPRWQSARRVLFRTARLSPLVRHAICSFAALSVSEQESDTATHSSRNSRNFYDLACAELDKVLKESACRVDGYKVENEHILASIFFLSYVELTLPSRPTRVNGLLRRADGISRANDKSLKKTPLGNQLRIWLKVLDSRVVSAGGEGIHLQSNSTLASSNGPSYEVTPPTTLPESFVDTEAMRSPEETDSLDEDGIEEILFHSLTQSAFSFYLQVLDFVGRIAHLDKWHRSRGTVVDELEVMTTAEEIVKELHEFWLRRPRTLDLAFHDACRLGGFVHQRMAAKVVIHLSTYVANYYACFIHLQRIAYPHLDKTPETKDAIDQIVSLVRRHGGQPRKLSMSMLWPLMMGACEVENSETREFLITVVEQMNNPVGNASRTARLIREICKRQNEKGIRADARTVMQEVFGTIFAIV